MTFSISEGQRVSESGRRGPYRQASPRRPGTAPALGLRAGGVVTPILPQTEGDFIMGLRKSSLLRVEPLEDRCLLSGDVVVEWNRLALDAIRQTNAIPPV